MATVLCINDLDEVLKVLKRHNFGAARCDDLGLSLGLSATTLCTIRADNVNNVNSCLRECLTAWLRKADNVESKGDPSYCTLIAALRSIGEKAVADGIDREKCLSVYDGSSGPDIANEDHAVNILNRHTKWLRQLSHPAKVATLLKAEGVDISDNTLADMESYNIPLEERILYLIRDVRKAVEKDYTKLRLFARVCKHVSDKDTAEAIMKDYGATFKTEASTEAELEEDFRKTIVQFQNEIEEGRPSDELLMSLKKFIDSRYSIKVNSASEAVSVIERKCTPFNITPLEEVTKELNCIKSQRYVECYKDAVTRCKVTCNSQIADSRLLEMEKLTIELECDHNVYHVEREQLLRDLFGTGTLVTSVLKIHHSKDNIIICSFPPTCASLLMKIILENREKCQQKGIRLITVGYCPLWNKEMCDEMYSAMDSKIKELSKEVESCKDKILSLEKTLKDEKEESGRLKEEVERLQKANDSLRKKLDVIQGATACDEKSDHEKRESDMELQLKKGTEELNELKQLLKERDEEIEALRNKDTELRGQLKVKSQMMSKMAQEIGQLEFKFGQMKGELEASLSIRKREIESLQEKLQSLQGKQSLELEQLQSSLQTKEDERLLIEKDLQALTERFKMQENEHATSKAQNLEAELYEKDQELSLTYHQLQSFHQTELELKEKLEKSEKEIELLQEKITQLSVQLIDKNQQLQEKSQSQQSPSTAEKVSAGTSTDEAKDNSTLHIVEEEIDQTETSICFHSSSANNCQEVFIADSVIYVSLHDLFCDSAATLIDKLTATRVRELRIQDTPLSQDSIQLLLRLLPQLRLLHFNNASLPATGLVRLIMAISGNTSLTNLSMQFSSPLLTFVTSTSGRRRAESLSHLLERNSTLTHLALSGLSLDGPGIHMLLAALANNATVDLLILDECHKGACNKYDTYYSVKHRVDFR